MKFNKLKKMIEAVMKSTWTYPLPTDKSLLLFDFYMLINLPEPRDSELSKLLDEARWKIMNYLKPHLLDAVFFAVCAEFRHVLDENSVSNLIGFFKKHGGESGEKFIREYGMAFNVLTGNKREFFDTTRLDLSSRFTNDNRGYQDSYAAVKAGIKKSGIDNSTFMELAETSYRSLNWRSMFGGTAWANICHAWLILNRTSGTDYNLYSSTGIIQMLNTAETSNETLQNNLTSISYNYCGEGYNPDSGSRGVANLWSLFAALIIAGAALFGLKSWLENR